MSEHPSRYTQCPILVVRVTESQVMGDTVADALRDELLALYVSSGATHVILDMGQVVYLSSAGIRPLLTLNKKVREKAGHLILCHLSHDVESVFIATRLISSGRVIPATFENFADVPTAVASLYQKPAGGG